LREAGEHREVGVKLDALKATSAPRCETVVVLQPTELALGARALFIGI
jgi:hypothetical protein